ncbi:AAA family ATPase [Anaerobiospirillum thomasii]|uniref:AAA family ATPase n=1 Tax=Anaerobiospirillum thomasii TaxID=179995 RepID=UPI001C660DD2|nr:AAA family ATPase [Anaerobiospirillum thomasii]
MKKKIPRSASFPYIISLQAIYVDKTDLIYDIACDTGPQFLSRPRRFGKSTIVSVLEELFTHGVKAFIDDKGNEHESYFKDLAIEKLWTDVYDI